MMPTYELGHTDCLLNWKDFSPILKQSELQITMNFKTLNIFKIHVLARFTRELLKINTEPCYTLSNECR